MALPQPSSTRTESAVRRLRSDILSGRLAPGEPIKDAELASRLEMSITPVREAVTQLISEGLIQSLPNKRRQVIALTLVEATELMDIFGLVLVGAFRRAAPLMSSEKIDSAIESLEAWSALAVGHASAITVSPFDSFVHTVAEACGNHQLAQVLDAAATRSYRLVGITADSPLWKMWQEGFSDVVDRLGAGSLEAAVTRLESMFESIVDAMRSDIDSAEPRCGVVLRPGTVL